MVAGTKKAPKYCKDSSCAVADCQLPIELSDEDTGVRISSVEDYCSDASSNSDQSETSSVQDLKDAFEENENNSKKIKTEMQPRKESRQKWDAQSLKQFASSNIFIHFTYIEVLLFLLFIVFRHDDNRIYRNDEPWMQL